MWIGESFGQVIIGQQKTQWSGQPLPLPLPQPFERLHEHNGAKRLCRLRPSQTQHCSRPSFVRSFVCSFGCCCLCLQLVLTLSVEFSIVCWPTLLKGWTPPHHPRLWHLCSLFSSISSIILQTQHIGCFCGADSIFQTILQDCNKDASPREDSGAPIESFWRVKCVYI